MNTTSLFIEREIRQIQRSRTEIININTNRIGIIKKSILSISKETCRDRERINSLQTTMRCDE